MTDELSPGQVEARDKMMAAFVDYLTVTMTATDGLAAAVASVRAADTTADAVKMMGGYTQTVWLAGAMWMNHELTAQLPDVPRNRAERRKRLG